MKHVLSELRTFISAFAQNWAAWSTGGVIVALVALHRALQPSDWKPPRAIQFGLGLLFAFLASFVSWRDQFERAEAAQKALAEFQEPSLFLKCDERQLPITYSSTPRFDFIDPGSNASRQRLIFTPNHDPIWPSTAPRGSKDFVYRCKLVNSSSRPVFNVRVPMKVVLDSPLRESQPGKTHPGHYSVTYESGLSLYSGPEAYSYEYSLEISELDGNGGESEFYFFNGTVEFAFLTPPDFVDLEPATGRHRVTVPLKIALDTPVKSLFSAPNLDTRRMVTYPSVPVHSE